MKKTSMFLSAILICGVAGCAKKVENKEDKKMEVSKVEIHTTDSGLKYQVLESPKSGAKKPQPGQKVSAHYTGWLTQANSEEPDMNAKFDSSVDRGQPLDFVVGIGMVIKGWDEAILDMQEGEKRRLIIPSKIGYGVHGAPPVIPPNATLVFDVELVKVH